VAEDGGQEPVAAGLAGEPHALPQSPLGMCSTRAVQLAARECILPSPRIYVTAFGRQLLWKNVLKILS
jgi:hypothetical protein